MLIHGKPARIRPSGAPITVPCPGSLVMQEMYPELEESDEAREGTAAHWVLEQLAKDEVVLEGFKTPNGEEITEEMIYGADLFLDELDAFLDGLLPSEYEFHIEQWVDCSSVHPENAGTPDAWAFCRTNGELLILDYKFGHGFIDVQENWQLINYAAGILDYLRINGATDDFIKIHFIIVQPRYYHREGPVRQWDITASDLRAYINRMRNSYNEATGDDPRTISGSHCKYCTARHACPAFQVAVSSVFSYVQRAQPVELNDHDLGIELMLIEDALNLVTARYKALEADAVARVSVGRRVSHWGTVPKFGRRAWKGNPQEVFIMGDLMGYNLRKPEAPITPAQALKLKNVDEAVILEYCETPRRGYELVRSTETLAFKAFKKVN